MSTNFKGEKFPNTEDAECFNCTINEITKSIAEENRVQEVLNKKLPEKGKQIVYFILRY